MNNFLALLVKLEGDVEGGSHSALGGLMVMINVALFLAVLVTSWYATQQAVDAHRESFEDATRPNKDFPATLNRAVVTGVDDDDDGNKGVQPT